MPSKSAKSSKPKDDLAPPETPPETTLDGGFAELIPGVRPAADPVAKPAAYQVLARRYRSRDFSELVGQEAIARTLQNAIRTGRTAHAYLFCGTRGVGKTSMARIFARALNAVDSLVERDAVAGAILRGEDIDVIEIDAASNRGIDNARELIANAGLLPSRGRYKIYIVDEVHMLTAPAFNALLKTMEEPPAHVKFILCTTEPQSVPATIQSRCQRFDFRAISVPKIAGHLREVLARENASADERVTMALARMANGSMRDSLSLLDRLLAAAEPDAAGAVRLDWALLEEIFGLPDEALFERVLEAVGSGDPKAALDAGGNLLDRGVSIERGLDLLAERFRWLMLAKVAGADSPLLEVADETRETLARLASPFDAATLVHLVALCDAIGAKARDSSTPRALFDAALVRMCLPGRFVTAEARADPAPPSAASGGPPKKAPPRAAETAARPAVTGVEIKPVPAVPPADLPVSPSGSPWDAVVAEAARSPLISAMVAQLRFVSFDGRALVLAMPEDALGGGVIRDRIADLKPIAEKALGRKVEVRLETVAAERRPDAVALRRTGGAVPAAIRNHPRIRAVAEALDATVVAVSPRPPEGAVTVEAVGSSATVPDPEFPDDA
jgi:DNA polymerase-3 subunit gamma/tau